jgi:hypothetical protein
MFLVDQPTNVTNGNHVSSRASAASSAQHRFDPLLRREGNTTMKDLNDPSFKIAEIDGPNGTFGIAFGGTTKENLYYLYRDSKYRFFFYADVNPKPIWRVTVESTSGISVSHEEEALLRKNIDFFFRTRDNIRPEQQARAGAAAEVVEFTWRVAR